MELESTFEVATASELAEVRPRFLLPSPVDVVMEEEVVALVVLDDDVDAAVFFLVELEDADGGTVTVTDDD